MTFTAASGPCLVSTILSAALTLPVFAQRPAPSAEDILMHAVQLAELDNWLAAGPEFGRAETMFRTKGDERNALYAHFGKLIGTIEQHSVIATLGEIQSEFEHNPLIQSDKDLKLFCLIAKGFADGELQLPVMTQDWENVKALAHELHNSKWEYRALAQLGIGAYQQGQVQTAITDVGMAIAAATAANDSGALIRFLTLVGQGYADSGKYTQALPYLENALKLAAVTPEAGYRFLTNEAKTQTLMGLGLFDDAKRLADEIRTRATQNGRREHEAIALHLLGMIADLSHDMNGALSYLQKSAALSEAVGADRQLALSDSKIADIYRRENDLAQAEQFATLAATSTQGAGDLGYVPQRLQQLAQLKSARGDYIEADKIYQRAESFVEAMIAGSSSVLAKGFHTQHSSSLYSEHFALIADHFKDTAKAFDIIEHVRGRITYDLLAAGSATTDDARTAERRISEFRLRLISAKTTDELNHLREQLFLSEQSRLASPGMKILPSNGASAVDITKIQKSIGPTTVLLEYVLAEPRSYCLVIAASSLSLVPLPALGKIQSLSTKYIQTIKAKKQGTAQARELYTLLIEPIASLVKGKMLTVIVRDGVLNLIPFDALVEPSGSYLTEVTTIVYEPSASSFYLLNKRTQGFVQPAPLFAIGGVPYTTHNMKQVALTRGYSTDNVFDLPQSKDEVITANAALPNKRNLLLLGSNATESAFKRAPLGEFGFIHLAVHAFASEEYPDRAAVVLLSDPKAGEDGFLQASEIVQLHINAKLVVLSACDTAVGPIEGEEGIETLSRAFLLAGASSIVSTLWSVTDTSSLALMRQFYTHLAQKKSPEYALAAAKRDMLRTFGHNSPPYFWAGFIFQGATDPRLNTN